MSKDKPSESGEVGGQKPEWTAEDIEFFVAEAKHEDPIRRMLLADDPDKPDFIADILGEDECEGVRALVEKCRAREAQRLVDDRVKTEDSPIGSVAPGD